MAGSALMNWRTSRSAWSVASSRLSLTTVTSNRLSKPKLEIGLVYPRRNAGLGIGSPGLQALLQDFDGRRPDENGQRPVLVELLDAEATFHVHIENGVLATVPDALNFRFEGAVESAFVHFLPFHKFVVADFVLEILNGNEMVVLAIGLGAAATVAGAGRNGKAQARAAAP